MKAIEESQEARGEEQQAKDLLRIKNLVFNDSITAISIANLDGLLMDVNVAFLRLWRYADRDDVIGKPISHFLDDPSECAIILASLNETGCWEGDYTARRGDGTTFLANGLATVVHERDGRVIGYQSSVLDVTARKRAETYRGIGSRILQLLNQTGTLQETIPLVVAEVKRRAGVDAVGIRLHDGEDFPYFAQEGFSDDFLRTENSLIARDAEVTACCDREGRVQLECACGLVLTGKTNPAHPLFTPWGSFWTDDARSLLDLPAEQDPRLHPRNVCIHQGFASMALVPIRNKDQIMGLIQLNDRRPGRFTIETVELLEEAAAYIGAGLMRRQTDEEKTLYAVQRSKLLKAEGLNRMAGAVAHHFNNKLMVVMGNLELAMRAMPEDSEPGSYLIQAMQGARQAADISTLMMTYLGQMNGVHEPMDLAGLCRQRLPEIRRDLPTHIHFRTDLPDPGPIVLGDSRQIRQILINLIANAQEAIGTQAGTIRLAVKTVSRVDIPDTDRFPLEWEPQAGRYACLEIEDSGCGIADSDKEKLFDPFFSTKFTGRGLGLPVVIGMLRGNDAGITVMSAIRKGSTFRVYMALASAGLNRPERTIPPPQQAPGELAARSAKTGPVLVIEDVPAIRDVVAIMLQNLGLTVLLADNGAAAVELFQQHRSEIGCVLCDLTMPHMDGWATLTALRALRPDVPVILASGYDEARALAGDHPESPQAFIGKPYNMRELRDTIERVLGVRLTDSLAG
ncbi:MAG: response regulator [Lentisphaerae bacterium]|nr:response regulator [Lentisphaerota bacterium]